MSIVNKDVAKVKGSATFEINEKCKVLRAQGREVYSLGLGQSPFIPPKEIIASLQKHAHLNRYAPSKGLPELREAVSGFYKRNYDLNVQPDQVSIGTGAKELLFLLQLVTNTPLILPSPCWSSYAPQAVANGKNLDNSMLQVLHTQSEDRWNLTPEFLKLFLDFESVKRNTSHRMLMLNYPSNPTGQTYSTNDLQRLAEVCREEDIIVISDEIYSLLTYEQNHDSIARYYPEGTIICSGLSKWCSAGGWRIGTFIFPEELKDVQKALTNIISEDSSSAATPIQWAAVDAFNEQFDDKYIGYCRDILGLVGQACAGILKEVEIITKYPQGGFYIFIDFENYRDQLENKGITTGKELCDRILDDTGVAILPGIEFMRKEDELSARIAFIDFDGKSVLEDVYSYGFDAPMILEGCKHTITAMEELASWTRAL